MDREQLITERRKAGAVCPKCEHPDYILLQREYGLFEAKFKCKECGHTWDYGLSGGIYIALLGDNK